MPANSGGKRVRMFGKLGFLIVLILDLWAIYHCWTRSLAFGPKVLWTLLIVILPVMGPCLYVFLGRAHVAKTARR